jgi:hypothetical protein
LWNRALLYNGLNGLPMRVIRDEGRDLPYSPSAGYRYDGLYLVGHREGRTKAMRP